MNASFRHWSPARILVAVMAVETGLGALVFDLVLPDTADQHMFNGNWPPHAKFHDAQYIVMSLLIGALALVLLARRRGDTHTNLLLAAGISAIPWASMLPAMLFPGTATYDPEFRGATRFVLGMHGQVFEALLTLVLLAVAVLLATAGRRRAAA
ncbi:hypothetical protein F0L68_08545 [Solihabitans fulvus]|uniref:Uncharacterized protein n=1 Tax=Solihabitans fulvus TaxID=1892852 RepID=A0A5B2XMA7_9PSEU|nr:DUF6640 family protein [Solihabitans fulvus]KAA2264031.1 hypothetical protein F0L68_08545 [Solihabitans fulvus]